MAACHILELGDPTLRLVSKPVYDLAAVPEVLHDLEDTLAAFRLAHGFGRGISAIQIGRPVRVIFCLVDGIRYELINPEWAWRSPERFALWDDCFSFPNLMVWLERSQRVRLRHQNRAGEWLELDAAGSMAELLQHEMDHLDGVLAVDHARSARDFSTRGEWQRRNGIPPEYLRSSTLIGDVP
ncbi:MAG TPA: peptide deformylase [Bryobacteraceae bacterium]|nr:peptide deformylase [Bryobacteraceae bacterium]